MDARAFQALDDAVHVALSQELDEVARLAEVIDELSARVEIVEMLCRRIEIIEKKLSPYPSANQEFEIARLYLSGVSTRGIAQLLGVRRDTVIRRVKKLPRPQRTTGLDGKQRRRPRPRMLEPSDSMS